MPEAAKSFTYIPNDDDKKKKKLKVFLQTLKHSFVDD